MEKMWIEIDKWFGNQLRGTIKCATLAECEALVYERFGSDINWGDTQMGFHITEENADYEMVFAEGGPELWEISMFDDDGIIEWNEELLIGEMK
jgi:hypothetical protein